ncbi:hypothetical protein B0H14DRAFT_975814 [Mycena olivaceomarginata]|nr:hypothetical protein B0H14DRAFT_975814 [Mycena olivaceomarginata]
MIREVIDMAVDLSAADLSLMSQRTMLPQRSRDRRPYRHRCKLAMVGGKTTNVGCHFVTTRAVTRASWLLICHCFLWCSFEHASLHTTAATTEMSFAEHLDRGLCDSFDCDGGRCPAKYSLSYYSICTCELEEWNTRVGSPSEKRNGLGRRVLSAIRHSFDTTPKSSTISVFQSTKMKMSELDDMQHVSPYAGLSSQPHNLVLR